MVLMLFMIIGGSTWLYFAVTEKQQEQKEAVAKGKFEIKNENKADVTSEDWRVLYPNTVPILIGGTTVLASVADTLPARIKGLSDTPFLPPNVVKLFVFGASGKHSIWMKNMNYPLDIIWADRDGKIVYFKENVSPDTYPESFAPPKPAWYVIEANAGFVASSSIKVGDKIKLKL